MRALLLLPVFVLAACAGTSPKDLEKMSTLDICYEAMMDPDRRAMVDTELNRRKETCDKYDAQLKKMAEQEMRAGGTAPSTGDSGRSGQSTGYMGR